MGVRAPFTAFLLGRSEIGDVALPAPCDPVAVLSAIPITATEAAWVRLKGADAMREAWQPTVSTCSTRRGGVATELGSHARTCIPLENRQSFER